METWAVGKGVQEQAHGSVDRDARMGCRGWGSRSTLRFLITERPLVGASPSCAAFQMSRYKPRYLPDGLLHRSARAENARSAAGSGMDRSRFVSCWWGCRLWGIWIFTPAMVLLGIEIGS